MAPGDTIARQVRWRRHDAGIWTAAASLPVLSHGAAIFVNIEPARWFTISEAVRWSLAADAMLYTAACATIAAPVAGVAVAAARVPQTTGALNAAHPLATVSIAALLFTAVSAALSMLWRFGQPDGGALVFQSHLTVLSVALALGGWGTFCGVWFDDALDAVACSLVIVLTAAGALLVAGAAVADLPPSILAWALTANPLVVVAAAAHIDIVRMDLLYQISPLAHIQFAYPVWGRACVWYLAVAFACFIGVTLKNVRGPGVRDLRGVS
jgi:hypothetical protein